MYNNIIQWFTAVARGLVVALMLWQFSIQFTYIYKSHTHTHTHTNETNEKCGIMSLNVCIRFTISVSD